MGWASCWVRAWVNPFPTLPALGPHCTFVLWAAQCPHMKTQPIRAVVWEWDWCIPLQMGQDWAHIPALCWGHAILWKKYTGSSLPFGFVFFFFLTMLLIKLKVDNLEKTRGLFTLEWLFCLELWDMLPQSWSFAHSHKQSHWSQLKQQTYLSRLMSRIYISGTTQIDNCFL